MVIEFEHLPAHRDLELLAGGRHGEAGFGGAGPARGRAGHATQGHGVAGREPGDPQVHVLIGDRRIRGDPHDVALLEQGRHEVAAGGGQRGGVEGADGQRGVAQAGDGTAGGEGGAEQVLEQLLVGARAQLARDVAGDLERPVAGISDLLGGDDFLAVDRLHVDVQIGAEAPQQLPRPRRLVP
jgi:hypothetical protein